MPDQSKIIKHNLKTVILEIEDVIERMRALEAENRLLRQFAAKQGRGRMRKFFEELKKKELKNDNLKYFDLINL